MSGPTPPPAVLPAVPAPKPASSSKPIPSPSKPAPLKQLSSITPDPSASASSKSKKIPVDPGVLADAMKNLDTLRSTKTPSVSATPSQHTSPAASGASSPSGSVMRQLEGVEKVLKMDPTSASAAAGVAVVTEQAKVVSAPDTPHFGAQTEL